MPTPFASAQEFREVLDRFFEMMSEDPQIGPRLREADVPQRFEFDDLDLVVNVRAGHESEQANLWWTWSDEIDWTPRVRMTMSSQTANRYFQGRTNFAYEVLRKRIKTTGDLRATLELGPVTKPLHDRYRELIAAEYPHLAA